MAWSQQQKGTACNAAQLQVMTAVAELKPVHCPTLHYPPVCGLRRTSSTVMPRTLCLLWSGSSRLPSMLTSCSKRQGWCCARLYEGTNGNDVRATTPSSASCLASRNPHSAGAGASLPHLPVRRGAEAHQQHLVLAAPDGQRHQAAAALGPIGPKQWARGIHAGHS